MQFYLADTKESNLKQSFDRKSFISVYKAFPSLSLDKGKRHSLVVHVVVVGPKGGPLWPKMSGYFSQKR